MSILLDALKKSERERQLGQTPTLKTGVDEPEQTATRLNRWLPLAMGLASAAAIAWFGWQQFQEPAVDDVSVAAVEIREEAGGPENGGEPEATVTPDEAGEQPRTMTELYGIQRNRAGARPASPPGSRPTGPARLSRSVSNFKSGDRPKPVLAESTPADPVPDEQAGLEEAVPEEPAPQLADTGAEKRKHVEPHVAEPISYWELPQGVRDNLPEIKITVLVYAERPEDRFLLTNGQRVVEKDEMEGGLVLEEIRKEGAVFLYRNYRFLVKG